LVKNTSSVGEGSEKQQDVEHNNKGVSQALEKVRESHNVDTSSSVNMSGLLNSSFLDKGSNKDNYASKSKKPSKSSIRKSANTLIGKVQEEGEGKQFFGKDN